MAQSDKIGALWKSDRRPGMWSGELEIEGKKIKVVAFENVEKKKPTHPDMNILISRPRPAQEEEAAW